MTRLNVARMRKYADGPVLDVGRLRAWMPRQACCGATNAHCDVGYWSVPAGMFGTCGNCGHDRSCHASNEATR